MMYHPFVQYDLMHFNVYLYMSMYIICFNDLMYYNVFRLYINVLQYISIVRCTSIGFNLFYFVWLDHIKMSIKTCSCEGTSGFASTSWVKWRSEAEPQNYITTDGRDGNPDWHVMFLSKQLSTWHCKTTSIRLLRSTTRFQGCRQPGAA